MHFVNDLVQGIIMLFGITAVIVSVLNNNGGFIGALTTLSQTESDLPATAGMQGAFTSFFGPDPLNLLGVIVLTSLGTWGLPQMVGKFYAIKDEKSVKAGTIISTIFAFIVAGGCYFLGGFARLYEPQLKDGKPVYDSIIPTMLEKLPVILIGIVIVLVLSASMSTLSSLVLTSSSTVTLDLIEQIKPKKTEDKKKREKTQLITMRLLLVFFIVVSVLLSLFPPKFIVNVIAQLMGYSWGALAGSFLAPFIWGLYWKKTTKASVWACFVFGVGFTVTNIVFPKLIGSPINAGAITMLAGLVIVPVVSLITPKLSKSKVDDIFKCYDEKVTIEKKYSLPEEAPAGEE